MNPKNHLRKRRKYDEDFKAEVLKMIENGQSISTVSQSLGIGENLIYRWKNKQKTKVKAAVKGEKSDFSLKLLEENEVLKEKVKQLETERDILKKALSIFSRLT
jgi:transposase